MIHPTLSRNPLATRADCQRAAAELLAPAIARLGPASTRLELGYPCGHYGSAVAGLESISRLLWAAVPLSAGGGDWPHWPAIALAFEHGTDPAHPGYWGDAVDGDQRLVEMAALGFALAWVPEKIWPALSASARGRVGAWLSQINRPRAVGLNNWRLFRILVNLGLRRVGAPHDADALLAAAAHADSLHRGDGWYADGPDGNCDNYGPFAIHLYALLWLGSPAAVESPEIASRIRAAALAFAPQFAASFTADGAAIPCGRSLIYRFAVGAFWGALAVADVEALPWPVLRGLWARHLRWWLHQPIFDAAGLLTVGHRYSSHFHGENYSAAGGPYWAAKIFLPLALPAEHPFWTAVEAPLPPQPALLPQFPARRLLVRHAATDHVFALSAESAFGSDWLRGAAAKYSKFAYSSAFGFSIPTGGPGLAGLAPDSTLALACADAPDDWRVRMECIDTNILGDRVRSVWRPWPGVEVRTVLIASAPWHLRAHSVRTPFALRAAEGGWALDDSDARPLAEEAAPGRASACTAAGLSLLIDLSPTSRAARVLRPEPGSNVLSPRTLLPLLETELPAGSSRLACGVLGWPGSAPSDNLTPPALALSADDEAFLRGP